jgi:hypothetical protein
VKTGYETTSPPKWLWSLSGRRPGFIDTAVRVDERLVGMQNG